MTLKRSYSGPTRAVFEIYQENLWLFSKLTGKLQTLVRGLCPCNSLVEQIHGVGPGAFQLWASLIRPQCWPHSHPMSVEKETGQGTWIFIIQDSGMGCYHLLAPHPHDLPPPLSPCFTLCAFNQLSKLCDFSILFWSVLLPVL